MPQMNKDVSSYPQMAQMGADSGVRREERERSWVVGTMNYSLFTANCELLTVN
jgi:hypothetical protein